MTTTHQFLLTDVVGPARLPILLAAFSHIPPGGRIYAIEQMEVIGAIKQELFRLTKEEGGTRVYCGGEQTLSLTPGQIELLRERITTFPFWNPVMLDTVAETYRWLGLSGQPAAPALPKPGEEPPT